MLREREGLTNKVSLHCTYIKIKIKYLQYCHYTHSYTLTVVSVISQFMDSPQNSHWDTVIRILRYLKGALGCGLLYKDHGHVCVESYTDADWLGLLVIGGLLLVTVSLLEEILCLGKVRSKWLLPDLVRS